MEKITAAHENSASADLIKDNIEQLKQIFPEVFKEGKVDFEALHDLLGEYADTAEERFGLNWAGKAQARREAQKRSTGTLRPCTEDSVDWDNTENVYIEGDNLEVLKLLQKSYNKQIKMIYIDPPYNTGKDFVYKDNYKDNMANYLELTGQDKKMSTKTLSDSDGRYHSNWLNMMYPRLKLARNLLTDDGVIFISIDDNEVDNLKKICNEIFGEENFIISFFTQVRYEDKDLAETKAFKPVIEQILVYAKNSSNFIPNRPQEAYTNDNFLYEITELSSGEIYKIDNQEVAVFKPNEWEVKKHNIGSENYLKETWISGTIYSKMSYGQVVKQYLEPRLEIDGLGCLYKVIGRGDDGLGYRYYTGPQKKGSTRFKMFSGMPLERIDEIRNGGSIRYLPITNFEDYAPDFGNIVNEGGVKYNSGKKPIRLLNNLLNISNLRTDNIVLDFFAGSSSTAHAVMQYNATKGTNNKFIMVQLPEILSNDIKEQKDLYNFLKSITKPTILTEIGKERIRRAGKKIVEEQKNKEQEAGFFSEKTKKLDIGFKVFKLDSSNINSWDNNHENLEAALKDSLFNIKTDRTEDDLLYEILIKYGIELSEKVNRHTIAGKTVYEMGAGSLIVCLADNLTTELAEGIAALYKSVSPEGEHLPCRVVFKESGFNGSDEVKSNTMLILKQHGITNVASV